MRSLAKLNDFGASLAEILSHSLVAPDFPLRWTIIANPEAGGFTIHRRWKKHQAALAAGREQARKNPLRKDASPSGLEDYGLIPTHGPGYAGTITRAVLAEAETNRAFYLFITAGGDGTSLEVLRAIYASSLSRSRCAILRLPLGTGNDGAEAWELEDALKLLIKPVRVERTRGILLSTASGKTWPGGEPFLAFNILSLGLDAFVTHMTNHMKGKLPGDSYKLWVDIASLLYDRLYKVGPMEINAYDKKGNKLQTIKEKILLCAMGTSGHRSYGSHKMILPDERNVCAVKQMSLFRKVALKGLFTTGKHSGTKEAILLSANRLELIGRYPILAQMDGETVRLEKKDFPVVIELTEPVIPALKAAD